jgi:hypothetical protein
LVTSDIQPSSKSFPVEKKIGMFKKKKGVLGWLQKKPVGGLEVQFLEPRAPQGATHKMALRIANLNPIFCMGTKYTLQRPKIWKIDCNSWHKNLKKK